MFINKLKIMLGVLSLTFGVALAANAQLDNGGSLKFTVAHPFVVDGKDMPAGKYVITAVTVPDGSTDFLQMKRVDGKESILFTTMQKFHNEAAKDTALVFDRVDDTYYLTEIRTKGDEIGSVVEKDKTEKATITNAGLH